MQIHMVYVTQKINHVLSIWQFYVNMRWIIRNLEKLSVLNYIKIL